MLLLLVIVALFSVINSGEGAPTSNDYKYSTIPLPKFEGDIRITINGTLKPNYQRLAILCPDEDPIEIDDIDAAVLKENGQVVFSLEIEIIRRRVLRISSYFTSAIIAVFDIEPESMTNFGLIGDIDKLRTLTFSFT